MSLHLLLIEDDHDLAANIGEFLRLQGHVVDYAADGLTGLHLAAVQRFDVVLLDLNLPRLDGISVCHRLRRDGDVSVPVLMLTARDSEREKLQGFDAGADDYLTKPFSLAELHARVKALARRSLGSSEVLQVADLHFDTRSLQLRRGQRRIELTPIGLRLLEALMRASPRVLSRTEVERTLWGDDPPLSDTALRGHIHALRAAIDRGEAQKLLQTVHGRGYRLSLDERA